MSVRFVYVAGFMPELMERELSKSSPLPDHSRAAQETESTQKMLKYQKAGLGPEN